VSGTPESPACVLFFLLGVWNSAPQWFRRFPCRRPLPRWILTITNTAPMDHTATVDPCGTMDTVHTPDVGPAGATFRLGGFLDGMVPAPHRGVLRMERICVSGLASRRGALANSDLREQAAEIKSGRNGACGERPGIRGPAYPVALAPGCDQTPLRASSA